MPLALLVPRGREKKKKKTSVGFEPMTPEQKDGVTLIESSYRDDREIFNKLINIYIYFSKH